MSHIFISYSVQDQEYVQALTDDLKERGFDVWIDDRILYAANWPDEVRSAIENCSAFIIVMSSASRNSEWVMRELAIAQAASKPIFSMLLNSDPFDELTELQYVDARDDELPHEFFYSRLREAVGTPEPAVGQPALGSEDDVILSVFVSYAKANLRVTQRFVPQMTAYGHAIWYDQELRKTGGQL